MLRTQRDAGRRLLVRTHRHDHGGARRPSQLDGRDTDAAGATLNQDGFTGLQPAALEHV